jgi:hypothetical protein
MDTSNFKTYKININTKNNFIKDNIENNIIEFNNIKDIFNNIKEINNIYYKNLFPIFFLRTNVI